MKKIFTILLICLLLITTCTGCQLALPEEVTAGDELVGVYVTTDDIRDFEIDVDLLGNISMEQTNEGKIYGTFDEETDTFTFPGITGYPLFLNTEYDKDGAAYHSIVSDASDRLTSINGPDSIEISGTFYCDANKAAFDFCYDEPIMEYETMEGITKTTEEFEDGTIEYVYSTPGENITVYCNTLYKTPTDEYYILPEDGLHIHDDSTQSHSYSADIKSPNGKKKGTTHFKVTASFSTMKPTETITFTQMDETNQAIQDDTYDSDTIPEIYTCSSKCQYIFITKTDAQGNTRYDIINKDEDYYSVFFGTDNIFCQEIGIEIKHK